MGPVRSGACLTSCLTTGASRWDSESAAPLLGFRCEWGSGTVRLFHDAHYPAVGDGGGPASVPSLGGGSLLAYGAFSGAPHRGRSPAASLAFHQTKAEYEPDEDDVAVDVRSVRVHRDAMVGGELVGEGDVEPEAGVGLGDGGGLVVGRQWEYVELGVELGEERSDLANR